MQLSKNEYKAIEILKKNNIEVFRIKDLTLLLKADKTKIYNLIKALKKKKAIVSVNSGIYFLSDASELSISTYINWPSYISFFSALNYYKMTDQMPKIIFLASAKYKKQINSFKFIKLSKNRFFGYTSFNNIIIAEKEKAVIDSLLLPKYSGGIKEIERIMKNNLNELNIDKLIDYSIKVKSKAVMRRLGFILEKCNIKNKILNKLVKNIGKGYEKLDPSLKKTNIYNSKWLLNINSQ
jgi:predicted transcriptional regulator of viral defense system